MNPRQENWRNRGPGRSGFTLVELLVVVSIIALLIAILLPSLRKARDQAKRVACNANSRQLAIAVQTFSMDHRGYAPKAWFNGKRDAEKDPNLTGNPGLVANIEPDFGYGYPAYGWDYVLADTIGVDYTSEVFKCPSDRTEIRRGEANDDDTDLPIRPELDNFHASYRLNSSNQADGFKGTQIDRLRTASAAILLCEGKPDAFHHLARWETRAEGRISKISTQNVDLGRHGKKEPLNYVFFDGHAEPMGWDKSWEPTGGSIFVRGQGTTLLTAWRQVYATDITGRVGRDLP